MGRLATGPIRQRRIVWSIGLVTVVGLDAPVPAAAIVLVLGAACAVRVLLTRVEVGGDHIVVVNLFRTTTVERELVERAGFGPARWDGTAVPLVLAGDGIYLRASGVSAWSRTMRWPDQPFVRDKRRVTRVQRFFDAAGIPFDPREPIERR